MEKIAIEYNIDTEKMNTPSTPLLTKLLYQNPGQATAREMNKYLKKGRQTVTGLRASVID